MGMRLFENLGGGDLILLNSEELNHCFKILTRYDHHCFLLEYFWHEEYGASIRYNLFIDITSQTMNKVFDNREREIYSVIIAAMVRHDRALGEFLIDELENIYRRRGNKN